MTPTEALVRVTIGVCIVVIVNAIVDLAQMKLDTVVIVAVVGFFSLSVEKIIKLAVNGKSEGKEDD